MNTPKPWRRLRWWITKIPTILKFFLKDVWGTYVLYSTKRLWISLIVLLLIFNLGIKVNNLSDLLWVYTASTFGAQVILQGALMIGMAIIQFVAIFWFMARTKTDIIEPGDKRGVTFADYKGQPNLVKMMKHWLLLMRERKERSKFQKMGGKFPTGILLYGAPGTGKTLLAKCMAGEGHIAFMAMEASGFQAMFIGVDVLKMMAFCNKAKSLARQHGACIAYLDEIDAIGTSRGGVMGGQAAIHPGGMGMMGGGRGALTRLLYEMDGMDESKSRWEKFRDKWLVRLEIPLPPRPWHVLYMGSTNRPDSLDPALVREGRFDRRIEVPLPDSGSRRLIIEYYLSKVAHDDTVDVETLVKDTPWATPAKIASAILKDAVRLALAAGRDMVSHHDIDVALQEQAMGLETPIEEMPADQKRQIAYHEAGHAVVLHHLVPEMRLVHASLIKRGRALAHVLPALNEEMHAVALDFMVRDIMVDMAGQASTIVLTGKRWTGTGGDYTAANNRVNALLIAGVFGPPIGDLVMLHSSYAKEVRAFWQDAEEKTIALLRVHWLEVVAVAEALLKKDTIPGDELVHLMDEAAASAGGEK